MKRYLLLLLFVFSFSRLFCAVLPTDRTIGKLSEVEKGSVEAHFASSLYSSYDTVWLQRFVKEEEQKSFSLQYSRLLLSLLPVTEFLVSEYTDGVIRFRLMKEQIVLTFFTEGEKIRALSVSTL